ncbi:PTS sugar transporter subunit IIA [Mesoplasma corruscae]|uniref:Mannitol-specific phosphotransferase enzyme IIA component n=1 Tax=Mesoplasma corruscae TaxID=216874 RepID=A0A2S5RH31_9MOLU|nr:PTS sugar transporter subunit IIA [Mesoplasma corruscae]PPE06646.1 PTS fructose transporter subunit IIA [Mesoplasma corruscae]
MQSVKMNCSYKNKKEALKAIINDLKEKGVSEKYLNSIYTREKMASFNIGYKIAIPHGTYEESKNISETWLVIHHLKKPIFWDDSLVQIVVGIAIKNQDQIDLLSNLAINAMNETFYEDLLLKPTEEKLNKLIIAEELWI